MFFSNNEGGLGKLYGGQELSYLIKGRAVG